MRALAGGGCNCYLGNAQIEMPLIGMGLTTHVGAHPSGAKTLRDHFLLPSGKMGRAIYGNQTHFVKLNDQETGGCWYECTIGEKMSDGRYTVLGQDGPIMTQYSVSGWESGSFLLY